MKQLNVYLTFDGNCEKAIHFYANCLNGTVEFLQSFGESPMEVAETDKKKVMHTLMRAGDIVIMASDQMPGAPVISGNQVSLSMSLDSEDEQTEIFNKLAEGGKITMPLDDTFWGARFGMLTDQFGIQWMFNCDKPKV